MNFPNFFDVIMIWISRTFWRVQNFDLNLPHFFAIYRISISRTLWNLNSPHFFDVIMILILRTFWGMQNFNLNFPQFCHLQNFNFPNFLDFQFEFPALFVGPQYHRKSAGNSNSPNSVVSTAISYNFCALNIQIFPLKLTWVIFAICVTN